MQTSRIKDHDLTTDAITNLFDDILLERDLQTSQSIRSGYVYSFEDYLGFLLALEQQDERFCQQALSFAFDCLYPNQQLQIPISSLQKQFDRFCFSGRTALVKAVVDFFHSASFEKLREDRPVLSEASQAIQTICRRGFVPLARYLIEDSPLCDDLASLLPRFQMATICEHNQLELLAYLLLEAPIPEAARENFIRRSFRNMQNSSDQVKLFLLKNFEERCSLEFVLDEQSIDSQYDGRFYQQLLAIREYLSDLPVDRDIFRVALQTPAIYNGLLAGLRPTKDDLERLCQPVTEQPHRSKELLTN